MAEGSVTVRVRVVAPTDDDFDAAAEALASGRNVVLAAEDLPPDADAIAVKFTLSPESPRA